MWVQDTKIFSVNIWDVYNMREVCKEKFETPRKWWKRVKSLVNDVEIEEEFPRVLETFSSFFISWQDVTLEMKRQGEKFFFSSSQLRQQTIATKSVSDILSRLLSECCRHCEHDE